MRALRSVLLLVLVTAVTVLIPTTAQADCAQICQGERQECMASQCPIQFYCEECEAVY